MRDGFICVAAGTPKIRVADCRYNAEQIFTMIREADKQGVKILALPELCLTGYTCGDLFLQDTLLEGAAEGLRTILEATKHQKPGKIYLMMGVNSLLSDEDSFRASYSRVVDTLVEQHPDAILYIQSILPVTADYEQRSNAVADNAKIDRYNEVLKELAAEKNVYYLNVAEVFKDADGCLPNSASPKDGIHFGSSWYRTWFDYLRTHGA